MKTKLTLMIASLFVLSLVGLVAAVGNGAGVQGSEQGEMLRAQVMNGSYSGGGGQQMMVQQTTNARVRLEVGGIGAECDCNMTQEQSQNQTKLYAALSNGKNAEIKVMPNAASETALEKLRLRSCDEGNNCSIELKEVGAGEKAQLAYEVKAERSSRVLGLFRARMNVQTQVNAETGEVISTNKPWWAFLATEAEE
ncbi:hypothetical protein HN747_00460 [archaeon]|jgi:hypothetical protein|nr:hypothetical protein [archaeon]